MAGPQSKCYISLNRPPKGTILPHPFNKQLDVILPYETFEFLKHEIDAQISLPLRYHRLQIPLTAILERDFFNKYIKSGNVLMLSEGRIEADNVYCLSDGKLRLSLSKEYYERAGLVGKPSRFGGRKRQRWLVEYDLRSDKMMHGKQALERIVWSFTEVLTGPVTFLFCDLNQHKLPLPTASCPILEKLGSIGRVLTPQIHISEPLIIPSFLPPEGTAPLRGTEYGRGAWKEWALDIHEWMGMAAIDADRIKANDRVDPYLSTYGVPDPIKAPMRIVRLRWRGIIPASFIDKFWTDLCGLISKKDLAAEACWTALTVHGFDNSPISWKDSAHSSLMGGENCYVILRTAAASSTEAKEVKNATEGIDGDAMEIDQHSGVELEGNIVEDRGSQFMTFEVVGSQDEHS